MNNNKRIKDLLYLMQTLDNQIVQEIECVLRGRGHSAEEFKDSIQYHLDEKIYHMKRDEK